MTGVNKILYKVGLSPLSIVVFILLALLPVYSPNEYIIRLGVSCLLYGTMAMGFDLSAGFIGVPNYGFAALMGLGGYTSALLLQNFGLSPWIGMIVGGLVATMLGFLIGILTLKMEGMFAALLAWFVGLILMTVVEATPNITRGHMGLFIKPLFRTRWSSPYYYVILVICFLSFIAIRTLTRSNLGLAFRALGQDLVAASTIGISPLKYRQINFCVSCFIAGICGGFYAHFVGILTPQLMHGSNNVRLLVFAYLGGRGSIWGALLAAFIITPIFEYLNFLFSFRFIIYGLMLILVMIYYPRGLSGLAESIGNIYKKIINGKAK